MYDTTYFHSSDFHILQIFADCGHDPLLYSFNHTISKPSFVCFSHFLIACLGRFLFSLLFFSDSCKFFSGNMIDRNKPGKVPDKARLQWLNSHNFKTGIFSCWSLFSSILVAALTFQSAACSLVSFEANRNYWV